jgi:predicted MFS family arabinose efflux permease
MTALCGLANNFWQLFLARLGVGVGEAGGVAPAYSLISDFFPPHQRARALSIYSFGIPIGSTLGIIFGGYIATVIDWRYAFFIVGIAGVVLAPIFRLTVREPERGRYDKSYRKEDPHARIADILRLLSRKPAFWLLTLGAASSSMMGYGLFFWLPSFLVRSFGMTLLDASMFFGVIILVGGIAGIWGGGWLSDKLGEKKRAWYALVPAYAFMGTFPFYFLALLSPSLPIVFAALQIPVALGLAWLGPAISAFQHLVKPNMRATASAVFLFINNLIGIGAGTWLIGALSDALQVRLGEESLRYSILAGSVFQLVAGALFLLAARTLDRDWEQ